MSTSLAKVAFRYAKSSDLPFLVKMLFNDALGSTREQFADPLPKGYEAAFEKISKDPSTEIVVAVNSEDHPIAMAQAYFLTHLTYIGGTRAQIEGVRVDDSCRDQGIGRQLMQHLIGMARQRGCHMVQLTTNKSRPGVTNFYEKLGFSNTHEGLKMVLD